MSTELEVVLAEAAINRLIAHYASMTDWMDWENMPSLFSADAEIDFGGMFRGSPNGFMPFVAELESGYDRRVHLFGLPRIDVSGDRARAECASMTHVRTNGQPHHNDAVFYGRYIFAAQKRDGEWKLTRLKFYLNAVAPSQPEAGEEGPINLADGFQPGHPEMTHS